MTDKEQIIIDGVDVSGCLFYQSNFEEDYDVRIKHFCSNWHNCCKSSNNQNCYFKQLARKTQECEELKAEKEVIKKYLGISDKSIMQRLEELTEYKLKRQLKYIKIEEERDRYLKALEEIQDFRKKHCDFWCEGNRILDIISKAKDGNG